MTCDDFLCDRFGRCKTINIRFFGSGVIMRSKYVKGYIIFNIKEVNIKGRDLCPRKILKSEATLIPTKKFGSDYLYNQNPTKHSRACRVINLGRFINKKDSSDTTLMRIRKDTKF